MKNKILNIYVGYDPVEIVAWHTLVQSIINNSSIPVNITPLNIRNLKGIYSRQRDDKQSNEFSYTRFLVPYLNGYKGAALYLDCDMLMQADIAELYDICESSDKAVHVVKHDYESKKTLKYLGNKQYNYPRKNWSSFVLWKCDHPSNNILTNDFVNKSEPKYLHRFSWLNDNEIGELNPSWNWLVEEYEKIDINKLKNIHWTLGGPYFSEYSNCDYNEEWKLIHNQINFCKQNPKNG